MLSPDPIGGGHGPSPVPLQIAEVLRQALGDAHVTDGETAQSASSVAPAQGVPAAILKALRDTRLRHPGKTIEDRPVIESLVRAILGPRLQALTGRYDDRVIVTVADALVQDPVALKRLRILWSRSAEGAR